MASRPHIEALRDWESATPQRQFRQWMAQQLRFKLSSANSVPLGSLAERMVFSGNSRKRRIEDAIVNDESESTDATGGGHHASLSPPVKKQPIERHDETTTSATYTKHATETPSMENPEPTPQANAQRGMVSTVDIPSVKPHRTVATRRTFVAGSPSPVVEPATHSSCTTKPIQIDCVVTQPVLEAHQTNRRPLRWRAIRGDFQSQQTVLKK